MAWYMGTLYLGDGPTDVRVIDHFLSDKQAESQGSAHPCCQVFPWAYFYNHDQSSGMFWRPTPEEAQLPPEYFGTSADRQAYADAFETRVQDWLADPNIEFVTSDTVKARISPARIGTLTADKIEATAVYLFLNWDNANRRPPRYVEYATGRFMSLADAFQALAYALEYYGGTGQIPPSVTIEEILAPIGETDLGFPAATVSGQAIVDLAGTMRSLIQSPTPTLQYAGDRVPYGVEFPGGTQMNPAQFLLAMADVYAYLTNFGTLPPSVTVQPQSMATQGRDKYLEAWGNPAYPTLLPYWYSELQMWTAKPARWRGSPGDFDIDGDVDLDDYNQFEVCFTGPDGGPVGAECDPGDFDIDGDIDCGDWNEFALAWTEPGDPPELPQCAGPVPTVSAWGVGMMILLLLAVGTLVIGQRRTPADYTTFAKCQPVPEEGH